MKKPRKNAKGNKARGQVLEMGRLKRDAAAWLLGISARTLDGHVDAPRNADGTYDAQALAAWWAKRAAAAVAPKEPTAKDRIDLARAEEFELKNAVKRGKLSSTEQVAQRIRSALSSVRAQLETALRLQPALQAEILASLAAARAQLEREYPGEAIA